MNLYKSYLKWLYNGCHAVLKNYSCIIIMILNHMEQKFLVYLKYFE